MKLNIIIFIFFICFTWLSSENKVIFFKLLNNSHYDGVWDISKELTDAIIQELDKTGKFRIIPKSYSTLTSIKAHKEDFNNIEAIVDYAKAYNANIAITAVIKAFNISTAGIISPALGGWMSHRALCTIQYQLININDKSSSFYLAKGVEESHDLGVALFGGPSGFQSIDDKSPMEILEKLKFGSPLFNQSIMGKSVEKTLSSISSNMIKLFPSEVRRIRGKVIDIDNSYIYINFGSKDNILEGQTFIVYERGEGLKDPSTGEILGFKEKDIANIKVDRVMSAKLCRAKVINSFEQNKVEINQLVKLNIQKNK